MTPKLKPSTRSRAVRSSLYIIFIGAIVAVGASADWDEILRNFLDVDTAKQSFPEVIVTAAWNTVLYTALSFAGGLVLGLVLALMKLSPVPPYRWAATAYIELFRGLPALLVIFAIAFALPIAFQWQPPGGSAGSGIIGLIVVSAAYIAETIRAGIQAVPKVSSRRPDRWAFRPVGR